MSLYILVIATHGILEFFSSLQVFTAECKRQYFMLFNALWKDKRMEMILSDIWKEQAATSKLCRELPGELQLSNSASLPEYFLKTTFIYLYPDSLFLEFYILKILCSEVLFIFQ